LPEIPKFSLKSLLSLEEAIEQSAVEVIEELPVGTRVALVAFSSEHKNLSNYIMDYTQAIRLDPNNTYAYNNRGNVYIKKDDYDRAIVDLTQAIMTELLWTILKQLGSTLIMLTVCYPWRCVLRQRGLCSLYRR
jgi:tetratricopeptide (TPR) repeat protein